MGSLRCDDEIDRAVGQKMQVLGGRWPEGDVRLGSGGAGLGDHRGGGVDAGDVVEVRRDGAGAYAMAAAEIKGVVGGAVVVVDDGAEDAGGEGGAEGGVGGGGKDLFPGKGWLGLRTGGKLDEGEIRECCHGIEFLVGDLCVTNKSCRDDEVLVQLDQNLLPK